MTSYDSMKNKLAPLGLYTLADGSVVDCELKAYAEGLDPLFDKLDELEREGFVDTAQTYGLSRREIFIDRDQSHLSVEKRRELLIGAEQALGVDATYESFMKFLADCGLEKFSVKEFPTRRRMYIYINDKLSSGQKGSIRKKITQAVPAHLNVNLYYHDGSHDDLT